MGNNHDANPNIRKAAVRISHSANTTKVAKDYELMVVACDPRNLEQVCDFDRFELSIFSKLQNFTFHNTLMTVPVLEEQKHGTAWSKGSGDLWTQIVQKQKLRITYNVTIPNIDRTN
ncbi:MAG: hypothetical protein OER83_05970 [Flavobacteriaceae bacterium]|nr:hypothetical protein [Flavobacteriaceae bacterium]